MQGISLEYEGIQLNGERAPALGNLPLQTVQITSVRIQRKLTRSETYRLGMEPNETFKALLIPSSRPIKTINLPASCYIDTTHTSKIRDIR